MSQPKMDHNDLARLLDRKLSEEERGSALAHLAESDDDAEVLGDAAYLLRELEEGAADDDGAEAYHPDADETETGRDPKVVPLRPPSTAARPWRRAPARWLALAAMLAGVLLVPLALSRSGSRDPGDFATLLASPQAGLPSTDWVDRERWSRNRGEGGPSADLPTSARLGALQVDLEVAVAARQVQQTNLLSQRIALMLNDMPGSGAVAAAYRDIGARANEPAATLAPSVAEARESLVPFLDEDYFSLGAWAEAAEIAAQRQDAAFFRSRASRKMLNRAASLPSLDAETRRTVGTIQAAAQADQPNWTVLAKQSNELLKQIAD
ncbi:MAG TPA: hypothetical protein VEQ60_06735 [Longimicrobium sp.]|nr:hypothetical protein [Longimicrobium sp.]